MMIQLNKVKYNPFRDIRLDPIRNETVEKMAESIEELGFWGGLAVRKNGKEYELAFGHHRLEALRGLGWTKADLNVVTYDDDQMVKAMVKENSTQRGGEGGGNLDSVAGIIRRLGYLLLTSEWNENSVYATKKARDKGKADFLLGAGIGYSIIHKYESSLMESSIKTSLVTLREAGALYDILVDVKEIMKVEAIEAQEKADSLKQAAAKRKAQAEADRKAFEAKRAQDAIALQIREQHFDPLVEQVFNRTAHTNAFRDIVTSENGKKYIAIGSQVPMAKNILDLLEKEERLVTTQSIRSKTMSQLTDALGIVKAERDQLRKASINYEAEFQWKRLNSKMTSMLITVKALNAALDRGAKFPSFPDPTDFVRMDLPAHIEELTAISERIDVDDTLVAVQ